MTYIGTQLEFEEAVGDASIEELIKFNCNVSSIVKENTKLKIMYDNCLASRKDLEVERTEFMIENERLKSQIKALRNWVKENQTYFMVAKINEIFGE